VSALVHRYAESEIPTEYGAMRLVVYRLGDVDATREDSAQVTSSQPPPRPPLDEEHMALVAGPLADLCTSEPLLVRVHSECWTGEVLRSHKCDCREQLDLALRAIADAGRGVVVYLRQEGRGIGLGNKVRAYALQEQGADTVDANRLLGFADDARTYDVAAAILRELGVLNIALLTNNPAKVDALREHGIRIASRVPLIASANPHNADYLAVKVRRMGHTL
jgi:GTP cyclohydrolase II